MLMPSIFRENLFDDFFDDFYRPAVRKTNSNVTIPNVMKTDIKETSGAYELSIDLPGYKKEDVQIQLKDGNLTISASTKKENNEDVEDGRYIRRERFYGSCSRSFYVGDAVTEEDIKARFADGILRVVVPKKEAKPEVEEKKLIAIE